MIDREMHGQAVDGPTARLAAHATSRRPPPPFLPQGAVTVPRVYPAASAAKVLTLERLYGTSLTDLEVRARVRVRVRAPRSPTSR